MAFFFLIHGCLIWILLLPLIIFFESEVKVLVTQLYLTFCNPMDYSLSGFSIHDIFQARILGCHFLLQYWSGLPCPPPGDLPNPGIRPRSPSLQVDSLPF